MNRAEAVFLNYQFTGFNNVHFADYATNICLIFQKNCINYFSKRPVKLNQTNTFLQCDIQKRRDNEYTENPDIAHRAYLAQTLYYQNYITSI